MTTRGLSRSRSFSLAVGPLCIALVGGGASGCSPTTTQKESPSPEPTEPVAATPASASRMPRCGAPETPALTSYLEVKAGDGVERHLEVVRRDTMNAWLPAEPVKMPMHHATAIRWTNLDDLPFLADAAGERLRFSFLLLTEETQQVSREQDPQWRTEYTAQVTGVCSMAEDPSRPVGVHLPNVDTPARDCERLEDVVETAARNAASCTSNTDCVVREAPACELRGLGCYWVAVHRDADPTPIEGAIRAYETSGCPISACDCPRPPETARCVDGRCAP